MREFSLRVIAPERLVYEGKVVSLVAPGIEGYLGVMAGHAPMLAVLGIGDIKLTTPHDHVQHIAISGGMLDVQRSEVTVLADCAEKASEIDVHRAECALERAQERLQHPSKELDAARAHYALLRAVNRLQVARKQS